jgi:predicted metal-dependent peptidase
MSDVLPGKKGHKRNKKFENLIGPTDLKVDNDARERLITARIGLLLKHSFFGNLATRLTLINADDWCSTAATDGLKFYYNSRFIMQLRPKEVEFLVGHEVLHVVYDHIDRCGSRDHEVFNIANDYAVNADLKRHRIGEFITSVPCLYDSKYDRKSSEEIYEEIMKNIKSINIDDLVDQMIDDHLDGSDGEGEGEEGKGTRPKMSAEERERARQEIKQAILNAASTADAGTLPLSSTGFIKVPINVLYFLVYFI